MFCLISAKDSGLKPPLMSAMYYLVGDTRPFCTLAYELFMSMCTLDITYWNESFPVRLREFCVELLPPLKMLRRFVPIGLVILSSML
jgi:hypothetical protein